MNSLRPVVHWMPAVICGFVSLMALIGQVISDASWWWKPTFFTTLPFCFFYFGLVTSHMQREIKDLRSQLNTAEPSHEN